MAVKGGLKNVVMTVAWDGHEMWVEEKERCTPHGDDGKR